MIRAQELIDELREERAPDARLTVLEVRAEPRGGDVALVGDTTEDALVAELARRIGALPGVRAVHDEVVRLPDLDVVADLRGIVRAAVAPVYAIADVAAPMVSQYVLGTRLEVLARRGLWWRVRGEDGYIGWVHHGYLATGDRAWAESWIKGEHGAPMISLGADLRDDDDNVLIRLPWGARVVQETRGNFLLPDGRRGKLNGGEVVAFDRLADRFPCRPESVTRTARRWLGAPYLWGGVTPAGTDCSGYVQSVLWMHGVGLPRDSDMQSRVGADVPVDNDFRVCRPGDLLFFAERPGAISHVGMIVAEGRMIHSSLSNGGVQINDLQGDTETEETLRRIFVRARRILPG